MKALILNSGIGKRMGALTQQAPKCMTPLTTGQTILSRQLAQLAAAGITEVIITTGPFEDILRQHVAESAGDLQVTLINNPQYAQTNYIYSIFLAKELLKDDILLLHGDLVFDGAILTQLLAQPQSHITVSSTLPLPEKDFKAVIQEGQIVKVGVEFFEHALAAQPLYCLQKADWHTWLTAMEVFVARGEVGCYAENALNTLEGACALYPFDVRDTLCAEIDTPEDLMKINMVLGEVNYK